MIPVMDDPLGKHWRQPSDIMEAPIDDTHVILTPAQISRLANYYPTRPSGVYPGKCWRADAGKKGHFLFWYGEDINGMCSVNYRLILIVEQ